MTTAQRATIVWVERLLEAATPEVRAALPTGSHAPYPVRALFVAIACSDRIRLTRLLAALGDKLETRASGPRTSAMAHPVTAKRAGGANNKRLAARAKVAAEGC